MKELVSLPFRPAGRPHWWGPLGYIIAALGVGLATAILWVAQPILTLGSVYLTYLVVVVVSAVGWGLGQGVVASVLGFLCANYFFIEPRFTFTIAQFQDVLALFIFLGLAILTSQLVARLRREAWEARRSQEVTASLYRLSQAINRQHNPKLLLDETATRLRDTLGLVACTISVSDPETLGTVIGYSGAAGPGGAAASANLVSLPFRIEERQAGVILAQLPAGRVPLSEEETRLLSAFADQLQVAIERTRLAQNAVQAEVLRRTDALRSALLSAVAHDLRTPLGSIKAAATSLLRAGVRWTPEEEREFLQAIVREVDHINRMASNLLDMSRIEAGRLRPHKEPHHITEVIETVLERLQPVLKEHAVSMQIEPDLPRVPLDMVEIDEVLTNLLENAARYTPPGTPIHIHARLLTGGGEGSAVEVEVADEGPGVPEEHLPHLFDRFYRVISGRPRGGTGGANEVETKEPRGTGLGLAIVKGIVEAHGGQVRAANRAEGGASFSFTLPVHQAKQTESNGKVSQRQQAVEQLADRTEIDSAEVTT